MHPVRFLPEALEDLLATQRGYGRREPALAREFAEAVAEAAAYVTDLARKRGLDQEVCAEALLTLLLIVQVVENSVLGSAREEALARIRDKDDWPALALALLLECAIWTEDQDFFGIGIATWTTNTVERYLES
jgi:predicted nucleic acid-binding protein